MKSDSIASSRDVEQSIGFPVFSGKDSQQSFIGDYINAIADAIPTSRGNLCGGGVVANPFWQRGVV